MTATVGTGRTYPASASALAVPLGGIGTGNVSLGVRGELRGWEISKRPAKGQTLGLLDDPSRRAALARAGLVRVATEYALPRAAADFRQVYGALAAPPH